MYPISLLISLFSKVLLGAQRFSAHQKLHSWGPLHAHVCV